MKDHPQLQYECAGGVGVRRSVQELDYRTATDELTEALDESRGVLLASSFEYPGRYTRWDIGFFNPPLQLVARGGRAAVEALNRRGAVLLAEIHQALEGCPGVAALEPEPERIGMTLADEPFDGDEEARVRRPGLFSALRALAAHFHSGRDRYLGLYGAFGHDLALRFEDVERVRPRPPDQRDLVLYLPDRITVSDHRIRQSICYRYEFTCRDRRTGRRTETTGGFRRAGEAAPYVPAERAPAGCDHGPGGYERLARDALERIGRGALYGAAPSRTFHAPCPDRPSAVFERLKRANPAPYGALMNLGEGEYLVSASPEMFARVDGRRIETCPLSGAVRRGEDALDDARRIRELLNSEKDEAELTLCTDADRDDKARVCAPGSVDVAGRRQIGMHSRLIRTVDHVRGELRPGLDALDGFAAHAWAASVTGAPRRAAMEFLERHEKSPRRWYGGALGLVDFRGGINTGLTVSVIRIKDGTAQARAGAMLLAGSDPAAAERATRGEAEALLDAVRGPAPAAAVPPPGPPASGAGPTALVVDHQGSFAHSLADGFRRCGMEPLILRPGAARRRLAADGADLVVLSPGPGAPADFDMTATIALALERGAALFGVCLGLQGVLEHFGGRARALDRPAHGRAGTVVHTGSRLFEGVPERFAAGMYHALAAATVPDCLTVTARGEDGLVMAVEHVSLPVRAVQFHPESVLSLEAGAGRRLLANAARDAAARAGARRRTA